MTKESNEHKKIKVRKERAAGTLRELDIHYTDSRFTNVADSAFKAGVAGINAYNNLEKKTVGNAGVAGFRLFKAAVKCHNTGKQSKKIKQVLIDRPISSDPATQDEEICGVYVKELKEQKKFLQKSQASETNDLVIDGLAMAGNLATMGLDLHAQNIISHVEPIVSGSSTIFSTFRNRSNDCEMLEAIDQTLKEVDPPSSSGLNSSDSSESEESESCCSCPIL